MDKISLSTLPKNLPLEFLKEITHGFSEERILSTSAFGINYKVFSGFGMFHPFR